MNSLNLRTRLLTAIGLIAVLQIAIGVVLVSETRDHLTDQIDDRLSIAASPDRIGIDPNRPAPPIGGPAGQGFPERLGDAYDGLLQSDGTLVTVFAPNSTGVELPPPDITLAMADAAAGQPITVSTSATDLHYRLVASPAADGSFFINAIPLDSVDSTIARLTRLVVATVAIISLALALITWWVMRLGITPIKRMTSSAEAIAGGDLSHRIADDNSNTEAGQLGRALNTMLGHIESSFEQRDQAEAKLRQFIADASHELRTPVATIRGYAELYRAGGLDDRTDLDDAMRRTEEESQRMSRLISDMLNLAKLDRDPTLVAARVDLLRLTQDAGTDAQATHPDRSITLDLDAAPLAVDGDEDLLRQALANVLGNAIVHTSTEANVVISARAAGESAVITVADDGDGMVPEVLVRVTERFFRADPSRNRHKGGSGLGLAITESVVDAHGGTLAIDSAPGQGTRLTITLPLAHS